MSFKKEVRQSLQEIKIELAKNTTVLETHHVRTSNIEARIKPVEKHVIIVSSITKICVSVIGAAASLAAIYHYFFIK